MSSRCSKVLPLHVASSLQIAVFDAPLPVDWGVDEIRLPAVFPLLNLVLACLRVGAVFPEFAHRLNSLFLFIPLRRRLLDTHFWLRLLFFVVF